MSPPESSGTSSPITASVGSPALTITMMALGRARLATKSSIDSLGTNVPSSPCSSTRLRVRAGVRLCSATACPWRAKFRARLRPITARPVTPMSALSRWFMEAPPKSGHAGPRVSAPARQRLPVAHTVPTTRGANRLLLLEAAGEAVGDDDVAGNEIAGGRAAEGEQGGVDAAAQDVEDVLHPGGTARCQAPQVGAADHHRLRAEGERLDH